MVLFAAAIMAVAGVSSWLAYRGARHAFESDFEHRLIQLAELAASQIDPDQVVDARLRGDEGGGLGEIQTLLAVLSATTGSANAALIDSSRVTLCDVHDPDVLQGLPSPFDTLGSGALASALAGRPAVSQVYREQGRPMQAGFAPVRDRRHRVVAAVAVETQPAYSGATAALGRRLGLVALATAIAMAIFAALILRLAWSAVQLEHRLSRAENLAAMGRLTATLAHEIKNPLAIIRGSAQRLGKLEPEAQRMADFVVGEADRLTGTVARYLEFARGTPAAADEARSGNGDALQALEATLGLLEGELAARRVTLERPPAAPGGAPVRLDTDSLKQVYLNLILNAVEAMPEGGRLTVSATERRGRFEVSFSDTGQGIAPELLKRLGSPFYTTKAKGSGLGLFLTRRLVRSGGGDLEIRSDPGRGAVCTVRLPRRRGSAKV